MQLLINVNNNMAVSKSQDIKISLQTLYSNITWTSHTSQVMHIWIVIQSNVKSSHNIFTDHQLYHRYLPLLLKDQLSKFYTKQIPHRKVMAVWNRTTRRGELICSPSRAQLGVTRLWRVGGELEASNTGCSRPFSHFSTKNVGYKFPRSNLILKTYLIILIHFKALKTIYNTS